MVASQPSRLISHADSSQDEAQKSKFTFSLHIGVWLCEWYEYKWINETVKALCG